MGRFDWEGRFRTPPGLDRNWRGEPARERTKALKAMKAIAAEAD